MYHVISTGAFTDLERLFATATGRVDALLDAFGQ